MRSNQKPLTQPKERPEARLFRNVMTLGRMTGSIAKELNESVCGVVINASTCLRMLSADPPNIQGARETANRTIRDSHRAAETVSRLRTLLSEIHEVAKTDAQ